MICEICKKGFTKQRKTKKRPVCSSNSCNAKWQYKLQPDWFRARARKQYWFEKENAYERMHRRNTKAKTRQRFGIDSREDFIKQRGGKCQNCGNKNSLVIHHIDQKGRNVQNLGQQPNNDISNLMVVCKSCHTGFHRWGWELKMKT